MTKIVTCPKGHAHTITTERRKVGEAYARNGNLHNPTPRYVFAALVDGKVVASGRWFRRDAVAVATDYVTTGEVDEG
jgi:hypothetical protein